MLEEEGKKSSIFQRMTGSSKHDDETETVRMIPSIHTYMHAWVYIEAVLVTYLYRTKLQKKKK